MEDKLNLILSKYGTFGVKMDELIVKINRVDGNNLAYINSLNDKINTLDCKITELATNTERHFKILEKDVKQIGQSISKLDGNFRNGLGIAFKKLNFYIFLTQNWLILLN
jgi:hypothetical protein